MLVFRLTPQPELDRSATPPRHHTFIPAISLILNQEVRNEEFPDCILRDQALVAKTLMESKQQKEWCVSHRPLAGGKGLKMGWVLDE